MWAESVEGEGSTFHFTMSLHWEGEEPAPAAPASGATAVAPGLAPNAARAGTASFDSSGPSRSVPSGGSRPDSRRASGASGEGMQLPAGRQRSSTDSAGSGFEATVRVTSAATNGGESAADSAAASSGGPGAEEQRQLLQAHHEKLLQKLAQSGLPARPEAAGSVASGSEAQLPVRPSARASVITDAPDTPHMPPPGFAARGCAALSSVSSYSRLGGLAGCTGSSSALATLTSLAAAAVQRQSGSQRGSVETVPAIVRPSDNSLDRSSGEAGLWRSRRPPPPTADFRLSSFFAPSLPPQPASPGRQQPSAAWESHSPTSSAGRVLPPPVDYRASSFFAPSALIPTSSIPPRSASAEQPREATSAEREEALRAKRAASAPAPLPDVSLAADELLAAPSPAPPANATTTERDSAECAASSASAPPAAGGAQTAPFVLPTRAATSARGSAELPWSASITSSGGPEAAALRGCNAFIAIAHGPTALQASTCLVASSGPTCVSASSVPALHLAPLTPTTAAF